MTLVCRDQPASEKDFRPVTRPRGSSGSDGVDRNHDRDRGPDT